MRRFAALLCFLLAVAEARDLSPTERLQVATQVSTWETAPPDLALLSAAELGNSRAVLAALSRDKGKVSFLSFLPIWARQGDVKTASEALNISGMTGARNWAVSSYLFLHERGLDAAMSLLDALPTAPERLTARAIVGQMVLRDAELRSVAQPLGEHIWRDYQALSLTEQALLKSLVVPTIALSNHPERANGLSPEDLLPLAEAYEKMGKPGEAKLTLLKLRPYAQQSDIVRIRSAQLLVKLGEADEAYRVIVAAPLFWTMQMQTVRELAGRGFAVQAAKLARSITPPNLRVQALAETAALLASQGQKSVALKMAREARGTLTPTSEQSSAAAIVRAFILAGETKEAEVLVKEWPTSPEKGEKLRVALVRTLAEKGDIAGALARLGTPLALPEWYAVLSAAETRLGKSDETGARQLLQAASDLVLRLPANQQSEAKIQVARQMASLLPNLLKTQTNVSREVWGTALGTYGRRGQVADAEWLLQKFSDEERRMGFIFLANGLSDGGHDDSLLPWLENPERQEVAAGVLLRK